MSDGNRGAQALARRLEGLSVLDRPAKKASRAVKAGIKPGALKDALSGTWMGHALHPVLTDVVIGTWTSALLLDLTSGAQGAGGADRLVAAGVVASGPTALSGLTDWADSEYGNDPVRRIGVVHAALNSSALALQIASLAARRRGARRPGVVLSAAAVGALSAGGWLGGHLTLAEGIGVDQTAFDRGPSDWTAAGPSADVRDGDPIAVTVDGTPVLLVRTSAGLRAVHDRCSHRGCSLAGGRVDGDVVECPCHASRFRLSDGSIEQGPATSPQPAYETREREGTVEIRLRA